MWPHTRICELLRINAPVILAPMGGASFPELVAAVSNAGGLGSYAGGYDSPDEIHKTVKAIRQLTNKPFAVNLFIPEMHQASQEQIERAYKIIVENSQELDWQPSLVQAPYCQSFEKQMEVVLEENVPAFSFTFGIPNEKWLTALRSAHIVTLGTATTFAEGILLAQHNIDIVVAQGKEAGGHRGTFLTKAEEGLLSLADLIPKLVAHCTAPIVAAGGIMNARQIAEMLAAGAQGVQMGTAFLTCTESHIARCYKEKLLHSGGADTTLTRAFSGKMARGISNRFIKKMHKHENDILPYPIQNALTQPMRKSAKENDNPDYMSLWAGVGVGECRETSALELMRELEEEL